MKRASVIRFPNIMDASSSYSVVLIWISKQQNGWTYKLPL